MIPSGFWSRIASLDFVSVTILIYFIRISSGNDAANSLRMFSPKDIFEDCSLAPEKVCFGDVVNYSVEENSVARPLGRLGPGRCGNSTASYVVRGGEQYISMWDNVMWSAPAQDREAGPLPPLQVSCLLGTTRYDRLLAVVVEDLDDNLPTLPETPLILYWPPNTTQVGPITLIDLDTVEVNSFKIILEDDYLDVLQVHFSVSRTTWRGLGSSVINIRLALKVGGSLTSLPYNVGLRITDVNHVLPNTVLLPLELRRPLPPSLSQSRHVVQYPSGLLYLSRDASLHARVTQPLGTSRENTSTSGPVFTLRHPALNITRQAGIVYVSNTSALQQLPKVFKITVEWSAPPGRQVLTLQIVDTHSCSDHEHHDNLCSSLSQKECLKTSCAYGLGTLTRANQTMARCQWVQFSTRAPGYSTCTADPPTCPDDWCDPLERLAGNLTCLQDCTRSVLGAGRLHWELGHGIRPLTSSTFCSCDHSRSCSCSGMPSNTSLPTRKVPKNLMAPPAYVNLSGSVTAVSKGTQTLPQVNATTLSLIPEPKNRRKEGCGFKCQTKAAIGVIFIMSSCLFILLFVSARKQKQKNNRKLVQSSNSLLQTLEAHRAMTLGDCPLDTFSSTCQPVIEPFIVPDPRWEVPRDSLVIEQCLGEGEFGRVLKAKARDIDGVKGERVVAVKTLKGNATPAEMADLLAEYQMLKDVNHPHVIRLLGACTSQGGPVYIIIEYAEHGSLRTYLRRSRLVSPDPVFPVVKPVSFKTLIGFAWQISKGMAYLSENKLVHRDLAARNVLLASGLLCKVSDFGLSRDVYEEEAYLKRSKGRVPVKWMAAESLADRVYTTKSDVWSYGVMLWELCTLGSSPYPGVAAHNLFHLLKAGYRMPKPHTCTDSLYELMLSCWHEDPMERPPFWQITDRLEKMLEETIDYLPIQLEKRLVINRSYLAEISPEDDFDIVNKDPWYKVPKQNSAELETNQTSHVRRYVNEDIPKDKIPDYDTPKKIRHISPPQSLVGVNNLGVTHYTVLKTKTPNSYQNDSQLNIDLNHDECGIFKETKYDSKKFLILNPNFEADGESVSQDVRGPPAEYVRMNVRRASFADTGPSSSAKNGVGRRASSVYPRSCDYQLSRLGEIRGYSPEDNIESKQDCNKNNKKDDSRPSENHANSLLRISSTVDEIAESHDPHHKGIIDGLNSRPTSCEDNNVDFKTTTTVSDENIHSDEGIVHFNITTQNDSITVSNCISTDEDVDSRLNTDTTLEDCSRDQTYNNNNEYQQH